MVFYSGFVPEHTVEKLLPDGSINIIIDMDDTPKKLFNNNDFTRFKEFEKYFISGQHKEFIHIDAKGDSKLIIRFQLGGAYPFFNFPISNLNNNVEQLELYFGDAIIELRKKILEEKDANVKFLIVEQFFLNRLKDGVEDNTALSIAIQHLREDPLQLTTKDLAKRAGVSQKHLISLFDKYVGLTPKYLARIFRFQKVLLQIEEQKKIEWVQITYDCGYYDQAHFIKDFYAFSGINPSQYITVKGEYLNYIPVK